VQVNPHSEKAILGGEELNLGRKVISSSSPRAIIIGRSRVCVVWGVARSGLNHLLASFFFSLGTLYSPPFSLLSVSGSTVSLSHE